MRNWVGGGVVCLVLASGAAWAQSDPLAVYEANTVHETRADGSQSWFHFHSDHTFQGVNSSGRVMAGKFTFDPATRTSCLQMPPRPQAAAAPGGGPGGAGGPPRGPACAKLPATQVGQSWDRVGPTGRAEHFVLEAGQTGPAASH